MKNDSVAIYTQARTEVSEMYDLLWQLELDNVYNTERDRMAIQAYDKKLCDHMFDYLSEYTMNRYKSETGADKAMPHIRAMYKHAKKKGILCRK